MSLLDSKFTNHVKEITSRDVWLDFVLLNQTDLNLHEKYQKAFNLFKTKFGPIIHDIHIKLASARSANEVKSEDQILVFFRDKYGLDIKKN